MPTCPSKFNICWTTAGLRVSSLKIQNTPIATATAGLVWTRPSTPTTMTTDIGSCGSCRCTVAKTRAKSSLKSRRASRRSRIATSDALASITSSKSNATLSWCTDQNLAPREKSTTDSSKQLSFWIESQSFLYIQKLQIETERKTWNIKDTKNVREKKQTFDVEYWSWRI